MVLDSSACLDLVLGTDAGRALRPLLLDPEPALIAPALLWIEVARVLRAKALEGAISRREADGALGDFLDLDVEECAVEPLVIRAWQLRENLTVDDAVFVALAEVTEQPFVTTDVRLARSAGDHARVEVLTHLDARGR